MAVYDDGIRLLRGTEDLNEVFFFVQVKILYPMIFWDPKAGETLAKSF